MGTHCLERADVGSGQDMKAKRRSEGNSLAGEGGHWNWSGHGNKARGEGHSLSGEGRHRDWSGHGNKAR